MIDMYGVPHSTIFFGGYILFGFFKKKLSDVQVKSARNDLQNFLEILEGMDSREIALVVGSAAVQRHQLTHIGLPIDEAILEKYPLPDNERIELQYQMGRLIRNLQAAGRPDLCAGLMVWHHSIRAVTYPQLRLTVRKMWAELRRGFEEARDCLDMVYMSFDGDLPQPDELDLHFIPAYYSPDNVVSD